MRNRKTLAIFLWIGAFSGLAGGTVLAWEAPGAGSTAPLYWMTGQVVRLNRFGGEMLLQIDPEGATISLWVESDALVSKGRNQLGLSDIREGEAVRVGYLTEGDRRIAREIILQ